MSRYVTVRVTQEDIDAGRPQSGTSCPIALALRRAYYPEAEVGSHLWWADGFRTGGGVALPSKALDFIRDFDFDVPVQPATFRLPLP